MLIENTYNEMDEHLQFLYLESAKNPALEYFFTSLIKEIDTQTLALYKLEDETDAKFVARFKALRTQKDFLSGIIKLNTKIIKKYQTKAN